MPNHIPLSTMVEALLRTGLSERQLAKLVDVAQSTIHRMRAPDYKASDALGQRVRALYRRRKSVERDLA